MFGGNLPDNDPFTLSLLTNKGVLEVLNKSKNNKQLLNDADKALWTAEAVDKPVKYLAVFNKTDQKTAVTVDLSSAGAQSPCTITDLWTGKVLGKFSGTFAPDINAHGAGLFLISK
jgi:hypothetical protein